MRQRDRHGHGMRGALTPRDIPLYRTRAERFDDLVLQALARLEPQWEEQLAGIEFAVEEIPPAAVLAEPPPGPVPLSRLEQARPRIVVYRRPLMARADTDEDLSDLVFDVLVEEFARLMRLDPEDVDPDYSGGQ